MLKSYRLPEKAVIVGKFVTTARVSVRDLGFPLVKISLCANPTLTEECLRRRFLSLLTDFVGRAKTEKRLHRAHAVLNHGAVELRLRQHSALIASEGPR